MRAYVLVGTQGDARQVVQKIRALKGVKEADAVWGPSDVIALVEVDSWQELSDLVAGHMRAIAGVTSTDTRIVL